MISRSEIEEYVQQVASKFAPEKIILFGSYAYGNPSTDSDVDLLVVMEHDERNVEKAIEISCAFRHPFPLDLFVRRPDDIHRRIEMHDSFIRTILNQGKVLYVREHA